MRRWIETVVPLAVYKMTRDCQTAKSCGVLSDFVCGLSEREGIDCLVVSVPRHFLNVFPLDDGGGILLDTTALQFQLPYGSYRDTDESEEQALIRERFRAAELDPFSVIKVERLSPAKFARLQTHVFEVGPFFTKRSVEKLAADMLDEVPDMGSKADLSPLDKAFATSNLPERDRGMISNPAWVDEVVEENLVELTELAPDGAEVVHEHKPADPRWGKYGAAHIHAPELGCGAYGCVLRTQTPGLVLKITSDATEATFARIMRERFPKVAGVVHYRAVAQLRGRYEDRALYALWREEADDVGHLAVKEKVPPPAFARSTKPSGSTRPAYLAVAARRTAPPLDPPRLESSTEALRFADRLTEYRWYASSVRHVIDNAKDPDRTRARAAELAGWASLLDLEGAVYNYLQDLREKPTILDEHRGPERMALALRGCRVLAETMASESPAGALVGEAFLEMMGKGVVLADVHGGNVGRVLRPERYGRWRVWVVTDPGHMVLV